MAMVAQVGRQQRGSRAIKLMLVVSMTYACFLSVKEIGAPIAAFAPPAKLAQVETANAPLVAVAILALCCIIAKGEMALKPPAAVPIEGRADWTSFLWMSALLSFASGMINAMAILEMGMTVAHHTGNTSHTGRLLGENAAKFFRLMVAFAFGAGVAGYVKVDGESVYEGRKSPCLLAAAIAVAGGCMIRWMCLGEPSMAEDFPDGRAGVTLVLWAFSQGLQNAMSRKCSSMPVCTTHVTGYWTDMGSQLGSILQARITGEAGAPSPRKPLFLGLSIFAFGAGGYASKLMRPAFGAQACLLPAAIMAAVAVGAVPLYKKKM